MVVLVLALIDGACGGACDGGRVVDGFGGGQDGCGAFGVESVEWI